MSEILSPKSLNYLARLARIEIDKAEEEKLLRDLQKILDYFEELKNLDTSDLRQGEGDWGSESKNVLRGDEEMGGTDLGKGRESFPRFYHNFLSLPPVFPKENKNEE